MISRLVWVNERVCNVGVCRVDEVIFLKWCVAHLQIYHAGRFLEYPVGFHSYLSNWMIRFTASICTENDAFILNVDVHVNLTILHVLLDVIPVILHESTLGVIINSNCALMIVQIQVREDRYFLRLPHDWESFICQVEVVVFSLIMLREIGHWVFLILKVFNWFKIIEVHLRLKRLLSQILILIDPCLVLKEKVLARLLVSIKIFS